MPRASNMPALVRRTKRISQQSWMHVTTVLCKCGTHRHLLRRQPLPDNAQPTRVATEVDECRLVHVLLMHTHIHTPVSRCSDNILPTGRTQLTRPRTLMHIRHVATPRCSNAHAPVRAALGQGSKPPPGPRHNNRNSSRDSSSRRPLPPPKLQQPARPVLNQPPIKHAPPPDFLEPAPPGAARQRPVPPSIAAPQARPAAAASPATTIITSSSSSDAGQQRRSPSSTEQEWSPQQRKYAALTEELRAASGFHGSKQAVNTQELVRLCQEINTALQQGPHGFHPRTLVKYVSSLDKASQARKVSKEQLQVQLQAVISSVLVTGVNAFNLVQLSMLLHALARMGCRDQNMQQLMEVSMQHLQQLGTAPWLDKNSEAWQPVTPAITMWAFGTAGFRGDASPLVAAISTAAAGGIMQHATPQNWSNLLWGAAKLGIPWQSMAGVWDKGVAALETAAALSETTPQEVSNLLWACATAGYTCYGRLDRLAAVCNSAVAAWVMDTAKPQDWANLLWAAAKLSLPWQNSLTVAFYVSISKGVMKTATPQAWANSLWAAAKLGIPWQDMQPAWEEGIDAVEHAVDSMSLSSQELSNVLWACAKLGYTQHRAPSRLAVCCSKAVAGGAMRNATTQEWANTLWALSQLGVPADSIRAVWQAAVPALVLALRRGMCTDVGFNMACEAAAKSRYSPAVSSWLPAAEVCIQQHDLLQSSSAPALSETLAVLSQLNAMAGLSQADKASLHHIASQCAQLLAQHAQRGNVSKFLLHKAAASLARMGMSHPHLHKHNRQKQRLCSHKRSRTS